MGTVATAATDQAERSALPRREQNAVDAVGRTFVESASFAGTATTFGVRPGSDEACTVQLEGSLLTAYLHALDTLATQTPVPYRESACRAVFRAFVDQVDVDAMGLALQDYQTLDATLTASVF